MSVTFSLQFSRCHRAIFGRCHHAKPQRYVAPMSAICSASRRWNSVRLSLDTPNRSRCLGPFITKDGFLQPSVIVVVPLTSPVRHPPHCRHVSATLGGTTAGLSSRRTPSAGNSVRRRKGLREEVDQENVEDDLPLRQRGIRPAHRGVEGPSQVLLVRFGRIRPGAARIRLAQTSSVRTSDNHSSSPQSPITRRGLVGQRPGPDTRQRPGFCVVPEI